MEISRYSDSKLKSLIEAFRVGHKHSICHNSCVGTAGTQSCLAEKGGLPKNITTYSRPIAKAFARKVKYFLERENNYFIDGL